MSKTDPVSILEAELPAIVWRNDPAFPSWAGIGKRTAANLDSLGLGPAERVYHNRRCGYPRAAFCAWLAGRLRVEVK